MTLPDREPDRASTRADLIRRLRDSIPAVETLGTPDHPALSLGAEAVDACLPRGGLARDALHEITPADPRSEPAAFGFAVALLGMAAAASGLVLLAASRRSLAGVGGPYGHGLDGLGLPPRRLLLVEAETDRDALWAVEESLRSRAPLAAVAGWIGAGLDLKTSRRLHLAAAGSGALLLVLRPHGADRANAAATRWHVASAPAGRDRFGCLDRRRWRVTLERCRNGRPGDWTVEWDHAAHRFGLVGAVADPALPRGAAAAAAGRGRSARGRALG